jgi:hypothetical protein
MATKLVSKKEAREYGLKRYFTGKACKFGHIAERTTPSGACVECSRMKWEKNKEQPAPFRQLKRKESNLRSRYGLEITEFVRLQTLQGGRCALCHNITKDLLVDHCHDSKKVRGLLCSSCNSMIGFANDNVQILQLAIDYLLKD